VIVADLEGRKKLYQVAERLYNIYYLMRRRGGPSDRVRALVNFMVGLYERERLVTAVESMTREACGLDPEHRRDHYLAYEALLGHPSVRESRADILGHTPQAFFDASDAPKWIKNLRKRKDVTLAVEDIHAAQELEALGVLPSGLTESEQERHVGAILGQAKDSSETPERTDEARQFWREAIELAPPTVRKWVALGSLYQGVQRYDEAETAYRKAIELKSAYAPIWVALGQLLHARLQRHEEAETVYRKAIELEPDNFWAWAQLGQLLHERFERYEEAEVAYRKAIELKPEVAWGWAQLGQLLHERLERYDEAEAAYRKAIELKPDYAWGWAQLGQLLHKRLGRYDEAEAAYRKAVELTADYAWAWAQLGQLLHERLGRYEEAETAYRKAIDLEPGAAGVWGVLGLLLEERLGRYEEAETAYRNAIESGPEVAGFWALLGRLLHGRLERCEEAEAAYRKALELEPAKGFALGLGGLAVLLLGKLGRPQEAFDVARAGLDKGSRAPELLNSLAWAFYSSGPPDYLPHAEAWAREAVEREAGNGYYRHTLACILCTSGKVGEAFEQARKYLENNETVQKTIGDAIELFVSLAARGYAREALGLLVASPSAEFLEPLVVGIRLFLGEDVKAAIEILEVGEDVAKRIEERRSAVEGKRQDAPSTLAST